MDDTRSDHKMRSPRRCGLNVTICSSLINLGAIRSSFIKVASRIILLVEAGIPTLSAH